MIDGLHLIFVELPKFSPHNYTEKKMQVLWLRYLTEINENIREVPEDLMDNPQVKKAVTALEESAFTDAQLLGYEKFWDIISVEKTLYNSAIRKGHKEGLEKGREKGREEEKREIGCNLKVLGIDMVAIQKATGLSPEEINEL